MFLALGITAVVCICVTVFCFQTKVGCVRRGCRAIALSRLLKTKFFSLKVDFTKCKGLFCVLGIVVFVTGIISAIVLSFKYVSLRLLGKQQFLSWPHDVLTLFCFVAGSVASHALCSSGNHRLHFGEYSINPLQTQERL